MDSGFSPLMGPVAQAQGRPWTQDTGSRVGCPIRKSLDQSSFAAPQGLSQRTTSFIASQRQGIHRMPLRHLIALMIDVRRSAAPDIAFRKTISIPNPLGTPTAPDGSRTVLAEHVRRLQAAGGRLKPRTCSLFTMSNIRRPRARRRIPNQDTGPPGEPGWAPGGARRDRTDDLMLAKHALSQLSYGPILGSPQAPAQASACLADAPWGAAAVRPSRPVRASVRMRGKAQGDG